MGRYNTLEVQGSASGGFLLGTGDRPVFLPASDAPDGLEVGQRLRVFVYSGSDGQPIASTRTPKASVGEFAFLQCVEVNEYGAFLDWGLPKDLFVPFAEQYERMVAGESYVVVVCLDRRVERPMASSKLAPFFDYDLDDLVVGDEQSLLVFAHNRAGAQVVVDQRHVGLIYADATFRDLPIGLELRGYIAALRADNRIDVSLSPPQRGAAMAPTGGLDGAQQAIMDALHRGEGFLPLHDKSSPAEIQQRLAMSKKLFKRSAGALYKARLVTIDDDGLRMVNRDGDA